jgi:uncharacterized protein YjbJ (UPF0337 family)
MNATTTDKLKAVPEFDTQVAGTQVSRGGYARDQEQYIGAGVALEPTNSGNMTNSRTTMDKDRIKGSAEQIKGSVKETAGKVLGDKKLETEGKADQAAGKVQNAIGGLKDAVRGK